MNKNQNPQHVGGPSFTPDLSEGQQKNLAEPRGKSGKTDMKSEAIREKHGADYDNYPAVKKTPDNAAKDSKTAHWINVPSYWKDAGPRQNARAPG